MAEVFVRVVAWLLVLVAVTAAAWAILDDRSEPAAGDPGAPGRLDERAPVLQGSGERAGVEEPTPLDPAVFFARLEGKSGEALRVAVAEDESRHLPARADVVDRIMRLVQSLAVGDRALGALYRRLLGMGPAAIPFLQPYLDGDDARLKQVIFYLLGEWLRADPTIRIPDLVPHLEDPDLRDFALVALQHGAPFDAGLRDVLVKLAPSYFLAAQALMRMGEPAFDDFLGLFSTTDERALQSYYHLVYELDAAGRTRALGVLRKGVAHPSDAIASTALNVLRGIGAEAAPALPEIRKILTSGRPDAVRAALQTVASIGSAAGPAVDDVLPWIEDEDERIAEHAALALGAISQGQPRVRAALVRAMWEQASDAAGQALAAFGADGLAVAMRMIEEGDDDTRYTALWTLAKLGPEAAPAVHLLVPLVAQEDDVLLRERAIGTAGFIGPKADVVVPAIMQALRSELMPLIASDASASMAKLGPRARHALRAGLRSEHRITQLRSAQMLQAFHGSSQFALDDLEPLLSSKDPKLRRHALLAARVAIAYPRHVREDHPALFDKALHVRLGSLFERMTKDEDVGIGRLAAEAKRFLLDIDAEIAAQRLTR